MTNESPSQYLIDNLPTTISSLQEESNRCINLNNKTLYPVRDSRINTTSILADETVSEDLSNIDNTNIETCVNFVSNRRRINFIARNNNRINN